MQGENISTVDDLARLVREKRKGQRLTQAELARRAGVSRQFVSGVEAGHPRAEIGKVLDVLRALSLPALTTASNPPNHPELAEAGTSTTNAVRQDRKFFLSLALHEAILGRMMSDPQRVLERGLRGIQIRSPQVNGGARDLLNEWDAVLAQRNLDVLSKLLVGTDEHSVEMRNVTPFIDVLADDERDAVVAKVLAEREWVR